MHLFEGRKSDEEVMLCIVHIFGTSRTSHGMGSVSPGPGEDSHPGYHDQHTGHRAFGCPDPHL